MHTPPELGDTNAPPPPKKAPEKKEKPKEKEKEKETEKEKPIPVMFRTQFAPVPPPPPPDTMIDTDAMRKREYDRELHDKIATMLCGQTQIVKWENRRMFYIRDADAAATYLNVSDKQMVSLLKKKGFERRMENAYTHPRIQNGHSHDEIVDILGTKQPNKKRKIYSSATLTSDASLAADGDSALSMATGVSGALSSPAWRAISAMDTVHLDCSTLIG